MYVGDPSILSDTIVSAVFTHMMNDSQMPIIHFAQISNTLISEGDFRKKIEDKILSLLVKFDFEICRFAPRLIEFNTYLNSQ